MTVVKQQEFQQLLARGLEQARQASANVLISQSTRWPSVDPLSFFACEGKDRFFWMDPDGKTVVVGLGAAWYLRAQGEKRFEKIEKQRKDLLNDCIIEADSSIQAAGPLFFGGFSFDPEKNKTNVWHSFSDAEMILPTFMLTVNERGTWLTINKVVDPHEDPEQEGRDLMEERDRLLLECQNPVPNDKRMASPFTVTEVLPDQWKNAVRDAAWEIREDLIEKVVLSRELRLTAEQPFSAVQVLERLREEQPNSFLFAIEREGSCFLGASPERLVKRDGNELLSSCIAGTTSRGTTLPEDRGLGEQLLHDRKNLHEHEVVVDMIRDAMEKVCSYVDLPDGPSLYKTKNVQHLYTPVVGTATQNTSILSLAGQLHPTPALGGFPQQQALEKIREIEPHNRGWYGAPVGWVDYKGDGDLAVAIRSGVLQGKQASLFAGNGIVGDSEPESEYLETQMKFRPMLSALGGNC
ncbi:MAG TPA: isochorismate synthase [Bacillales bacterium]|nr:isochorismate synthase [Bacillales bacterium]